MKLYEMGAEYLNALNSLQYDEDTGEVTGFEAVEELQAAFEDKAEAVALYIKSLNADATAFATEIAQLENRKRAAKRKAEWLKGYLLSCMAESGINKISTPRAAVSIRNGSKLELDDDFMVYAQDYRDDLLRYKLPEPDKIKIANLIKNGVEIPYAKIVKNQNLIIK